MKEVPRSGISQIAINASHEAALMRERHARIEISGFVTRAFAYCIQFYHYIEEKVKKEGIDHDRKRQNIADSRPA